MEINSDFDDQHFDELNFNHGQVNSNSIKSFAKVNLWLKVLDKRPDGYHNIDTLFYKINLYDTLTIKKSTHTSLKTNSKEIPTNDTNIIIQLNNILTTEHGLQEKFEIYLDKNIPVSAGLGGGSSNAAAYLLLVNKVAKLNLTDGQMHSILTRLGSDTALFLHFNKPGSELNAMHGTGRGELLTPIKNFPTLYLILINPLIAISATEAYADNIFKLTSSDNSNRMPIAIDDNLDNIVNVMHNDLQNAIESKYSVISTLLTVLQSTGALASIMSGSGPTVYGLFRTQNEQATAFKQLLAKYPNYLVLKI